MWNEEKVPYPRPDYHDRDLASKEMVNGTFAKAIMDDVSHFRPVLDRYNVTEDKLVERSIESGSIRPEDYDITMRDVTLAGVKETSWQPYYIKADKPEPEVVYNPLDYYSFVEWRGYSYTDLPGIPSSDEVGYRLNTIYYDDESPGLFGFKIIKDPDGNITDVYAAYYNLITEDMTILGRLPDGHDIDDATYIGYVKGSYILNFTGGRYISFTLDGSVYEANGYTDRFTPLGEYGCFAVTDGGNTYILNTELIQQRFAPPYFDPDAPPIYSIQGDYCAASMGFASGQTKYPFGTKIRSSIYAAKSENESYRYKNTKFGWIVDTLDNAAWKYSKRIKYDYATDNWLHHPLKTLHYNMIVHGIFVKNRLPKHSKGDSVSFPNSDMYGDFAQVTRQNGAKATYHTYDFKKWEVVTGDGADQLYGCSGRIWLSGRGDGIRGMLPYTVEIADVSDLNGGRKTVLKFKGFIFRGGA